MITIVKTFETAGNANETIREIVMLRKGDKYAIARRDWRANQWTNIERTSSEGRAALLNAGWRTASGGWTEQVAERVWRRLTMPQRSATEAA